MKSFADKNFEIIVNAITMKSVSVNHLEIVQQKLGSLSKQ